MTRHQIIDTFISDVWDYLHSAAGTCGHCGKYKCSKRAGWSIVGGIDPDQLSAAFDAAVQRRAKRRATKETP
jgi:hypothetical protein